MEESSESLVRLENNEIPEFPLIGLREISTVDDNMAIISILQDDQAARYQRIMLAFSFFDLPETPETFLEEEEIFFSEKYVKGHGQFLIRLDGDEILLLEYLVDSQRYLDRFISAIDFCHSQGNNLLLDANVNLI